MLPHKRRIAEDIIHVIDGNNIVPVHPQGIAAMDFCSMHKRQAAEILAELLRHQHIHLVVGEPEGHLRYLGWNLQFDAVELIDVDLYELKDVEVLLTWYTRGAENFEFEQPQFLYA
jgi:hypothetical protein